MHTQRKKGTVKWFNVRDGYGFIEPAEGGDDIFLHVSMLKIINRRYVKEGQKLEYEIGTAPNNRPCAKEVVIIDEILE